MLPTYDSNPVPDPHAMPSRLMLKLVQRTRADGRYAELVKTLDDSRYGLRTYLPDGTLFTSRTFYDYFSAVKVFNSWHANPALKSGDKVDHDHYGTGEVAELWTTEDGEKYARIEFGKSRLSANLPITELYYPEGD